MAKKTYRWHYKLVGELILALFVVLLAACDSSTNNSTVSSPTPNKVASNTPVSSTTTPSAADAIAKLEQAKSYHFIYTNTTILDSKRTITSAEGDYLGNNDVNQRGYRYTLTGAGDKWDGDWIDLRHKVYHRAASGWEEVSSVSPSPEAQIYVGPDIATVVGGWHLSPIDQSPKGQERVNGVDTTLYNIKGSIMTIPTDWDVWVSNADGNVVRMGTRQARVKVTVDFSKLNEPVTIEAPIK